MNSRAQGLAAVACLATVLVFGTVAKAGPMFGNNAITFSRIKSVAGVYDVTDAAPTLTKLDNGFKVEYSYTITMLNVEDVSITWDAQRQFDLANAETLAVRINRNTTVTLPANTRLDLAVDGRISESGVGPVVDFLSGDIKGPQNNMNVQGDKTSDATLVAAKNGLVLEMFSGPELLPNAVGDKFTVSSEYVVTVVPEPTTFTLVGIGIAGMDGYAWRRKRQKATA